MTPVEFMTWILKLKFKNTMLKSSLSDYGDAYTLVKQSLTVTG